MLAYRCRWAAAAIEKARPVLNALDVVRVVGEAAAAACLVKAAGTLLMASAVESLREAVALADKSGADPQVLVDLVTETIFPTSFYRRFGGALAKHQKAGTHLASPFGPILDMLGDAASGQGSDAALTAFLSGQIARGGR